MAEERRKKRRFPIQQPVTLMVKRDGKRSIHGRSDNVSLTGVLLSTDSEISEEARVDVMLAASQRNMPVQKLLLLSSGRVVRVETRLEGGKAIAIKCDYDLEQIPATHGV